jgi:hypothetical protein
MALGSVILGNPLGPADTGRIRQPGGVKIFCVGKQLQREAYVACGLVVNVGPQFIAAPVNGERAHAGIL